MLESSGTHAVSQPDFTLELTVDEMKPLIAEVGTAHGVVFENLDDVWSSISLGYIGQTGPVCAYYGNDGHSERSAALADIETCLVEDGYLLADHPRDTSIVQAMKFLAAPAHRRAMFVSTPVDLDDWFGHMNMPDIMEERFEIRTYVPGADREPDYSPVPALSPGDIVYYEKEHGVQPMRVVEAYRSGSSSGTPEFMTMDHNEFFGFFPRRWAYKIAAVNPEYAEQIKGRPISAPWLSSLTLTPP